jgi:hypothetical protein
MFCCAASTGENPCFPDRDVLVSVNGTVVAGSEVTAVVVGSEFSAVTFNGTTVLPDGATGFSESTVAVPTGTAVLPVAPCVGMDTLDARAFFALFA